MKATLILFAVFAAIVECSCAPSRFVMKNDQKDTEAVCYVAGGGLFGGPALQCIAAHDAVADGGVADGGK